MVWYKFVIPWYVSPWYGMTMGWLYTLGKPLAWCVAYTILSVAVFLSSLFFVLLKWSATLHPLNLQIGSRSDHTIY